MVVVAAGAVPSSPPPLSVPPHAPASSANAASNTVNRTCRVRMKNLLPVGRALTRHAFLCSQLADGVNIHGI